MTVVDATAPVAPPARVRLLPLGDSAWTLEFGQQIDPVTHARVMGMARRLAQARASAPDQWTDVVDLVPSFRSLTVHLRAGSPQAHALGERLLALAHSADNLAITGRRWRLPLCLDEDFAPDLPRVCQTTGCHAQQVHELLLATPFRVYLIGFQPGFPYMGGLPPALSVPRLPTPRTKVPAQSVAITGSMCAVYPWDSPGGWNLMGRTAVRLFDPQRPEQPAMLAAGDEVRWTAVNRATHERLCTDVSRGLPPETFLDGLAP